MADPYLTGAILHFGERGTARDGGHYVSVQLTKAGAFVIDDDKVFQTSPETALELVSHHGKILLFGPAPDTTELPESIRRSSAHRTTLTIHDVAGRTPDSAGRRKEAGTDTPKLGGCSGPAGTPPAPGMRVPMEDEPAEPAHGAQGLGRSAQGFGRSVQELGLDRQVELLRLELQRLAFSDTSSDATVSTLGLSFPHTAGEHDISMLDLESAVEAADRDLMCGRGPGTLLEHNFPWFAVIVLSGPALALFTREGKAGRRHVNTDEVQRIFGATVLRSVYRPGRRPRTARGGGVLTGASDPTLVLELPSESAHTRLCRAVASLPAQGPFRLRLHELPRDLIPSPELYPNERNRRCPGRVMIQNIRAAGPTQAVGIAKRLVLESLKRDAPPDEAEVFMVGGSASQGAPGSKSWTVFLPLLDPAVAEQAVTGLHQRVVNKSVIMAYGAGPLAHCALCGSRGHSQDECRVFTLLLFKRDGVPWTQPEIEDHNKGLQAMRCKRGYGGEGPSSLLILLFGNERDLTCAVLSVVRLMRSGAPHPYATAPRFTEGFCPRGCNRCLWPRTRADVHTAATCPGTRLLPATLPVRIAVDSEGFAEIGKDGAAEPRSVPVCTSTAPPEPRVAHPPLAHRDSAAHCAAPSRPAPSPGAEEDSTASAAAARDKLGLPPTPVSPATLPPTHALPSVPDTGSQPARAVDYPSTPVRHSTRTVTPSPKALELIASRPLSFSPGKAPKRPHESEGFSDAGATGGELLPLAPGETQMRPRKKKQNSNSRRKY
jgi:hypothetical protein